MKTTVKQAARIAATTAAMVLVVAGARPVSAADAPAPAPTIPVAKSADLIINASPTSDGLELHILHAANQIPIDGRDVTATVDGKSQPLTVEKEVGTFLLPAKDLGEGERQLEITVAHDGIREILSGKVAIPKSSTSGGLWDSSRKQMLWWVLNIGVVLVAVLAFSKRSSAPPAKDADEDE
jgi:hypothetical protein